MFRRRHQSVHTGSDRLREASPLIASGTRSARGFALELGDTRHRGSTGLTCHGHPASNSPASSPTATTRARGPGEVPARPALPTDLGSLTHPLPSSPPFLRHLRSFGRAPPPYSPPASWLSSNNVSLNKRAASMATVGDYGRAQGRPPSPPPRLSRTPRTATAPIAAIMDFVELFDSGARSPSSPPSLPPRAA